MKRLNIFIILLFVSCSLSAYSGTSQDSLLRIVRTTKDMKQKFIAYRNLADINFEEPAERVYLQSAYKVAQQIGDKEEFLNVLSELAYAYIKINKQDSVSYYMNMISSESEPKIVDSYLAYLRMKLFDKRSSEGNEETKAAMKEEMEVFKNADKNNIYIRIEQAYVTGSSLRDNAKYAEAVPYLEAAYNLAKTLDPNVQYKYLTLIGWVYSAPFRYLGNLSKSLELTEEVLKRYKDQNDKYYSIYRPFYPIHLFYLQCYGTIMMHVNILSKAKAQYYINEITKLVPKVTTPFDKYNCFLALNNYFSYNHDYKKALAFNDSLIKYAQIISPVHIAGLLQIESELYVKMNDYENALKSHIRYTNVKDSMNSKQVEEQLNHLQVQYKLDKLTYEKISMANDNKRTILIILSFVLVLIVLICIYLYYHMKKEQRMKLKLHELNEKAQESEKLKIVFINSICHEIRTPLNAIVGFSGIIADESIDPDTKHEFYDQITTNSNKLTSLIDHLLIVATLDSSEGRLPCAPANIVDICREEMNRVKLGAKNTIIYNQEYSQEEICIPTNSKYLALAIENLLDNANKFTTEGEIKLQVSIDTNRNQVQIDVTDTGSGIPLDQQEYVFERFTKLDTFVPGNGLGLYLCRLIIKRLSGSIFIDPAYTNGTRFVICLPLS